MHSVNIVDTFQANVKLEDDNILADILGELDDNKANVLGTNTHPNSSLKKIQEEKNAINEYMASFTKKSLKKRDSKQVDAASDDDVSTCQFPLG